MSNDKKIEDTINETAETVQGLVDDAKETVSEVVEDVTETVSEVVEDATEALSETADAASDAAEGAVAKVMAIKESNPKLFFGALIGVVLIILFLMMSGGSDKKMPVSRSVNLAVGQTYSLKGANTYDPKATIRLVAIPGSIAAYDDTEKEDRDGGCKHMPQGTKVKLLQIQAAFGQAKFVQVEMLNGECAGKKGWAVSNNLN